MDPSLLILLVLVAAGVVGAKAVRDSREAAPADAPRVGGWGFAAFLLGALGGAIGYFALKDDEPKRASHVMKWGLIWTAVGISLWTIGVLAGG